MLVATAKSIANLVHQHFWILPTEKPEPTKATFYTVRFCDGEYAHKKSGSTKNIHEARFYKSAENALRENQIHLPIQVVRIDATVTIEETPPNTV